MRLPGTAPQNIDKFESYLGAKHTFSCISFNESPFGAGALPLLKSVPTSPELNFVIQNRNFQTVPGCEKCNLGIKSPRLLNVSPWTASPR